MRAFLKDYQAIYKCVFQTIKIMKQNLKKLLNKETLILLAIVLLATIVRFYNFSDRVTFWSEQARSMVVSANYLNKPSLLGQEYFRQDSNSHTIYSGAMFNYFLLPLMIITNYDPIAVTVFFGLLNILTGIVIYLVVKKMSGFHEALFSTILFLFHDFMIYHSLFIWNYNFLPLCGVLLIYFYWKYGRHRKDTDLFWIGILCGAGISLQILFIPIAAMVLLLVFAKKPSFKGIGLFLLGMALPSSPAILFDLRHNFYEARTLINFLTDTVKGTSDAAFSYYYLLPFWPLAAIIPGWILGKIYRNNKLLVTVVVLIYIYLNLTSAKVNFLKPSGMPDGLTVKEFVYGKKPLGETEYENLERLYVLSPTGFNFNDTNIWEINASGLDKADLLSEVGSGYAVYKLSQ